MSQHLQRLRDDGLVATRRAGTTIHYRVADPRVARIIGTLRTLFCPPATDMPRESG
jgi:DNA-binding transcriptional ArsR family regulator